MKTAVSLPDDLFQRADALARRTGISRSRVFQDALTEYLAQREPSVVTGALNDIADRVDTEPDPWLAAAGRRALERGEW